MGIFDCKLIAFGYSVKEKIELLDNLKQYKNVLSGPMIEYLNSLIELEFSAIGSEISEEDKMALSQLKIYKDIAIYNICNRTLNIFVQDNLDIVTEPCLKVWSPLSNNKNCLLFKFQYGVDPYIKDGQLEVGDISLFKSVENEEIRNEELERVSKRLDALQHEINPYTPDCWVYGGPSTNWEFEHLKKINDYKNKLNELISRKGLTKAEKEEIKITNEFHDILLGEFELTENDFEEINPVFDEEPSKLNKTLIKILPSVSIQDNIKYI